jgi:hypothetical protein
MRAAYPKTKCNICGTEISISGLAKTNHMMKHIRAGEAIALVYTGKAPSWNKTVYYVAISERPWAEKQMAGSLEIGVGCYIADAAYLEESKRKANEYLTKNSSKPVSRGTIF